MFNILGLKDKPDFIEVLTWVIAATNQYLVAMKLILFRTMVQNRITLEICGPSKIQMNRLGFTPLKETHRILPGKLSFHLSLKLSKHDFQQQVCCQYQGIGMVRFGIKPFCKAQYAQVMELLIILLNLKDGMSARMLCTGQLCCLRQAEPHTFNLQAVVLLSLLSTYIEV